MVRGRVAAAGSVRAFAGGALGFRRGGAGFVGDGAGQARLAMAQQEEDVGPGGDGAVLEGKGDKRLACELAGEGEQGLVPCFAALLGGLGPRGLRARGHFGVMDFEGEFGAGAHGGRIAGVGSAGEPVQGVAGAHLFGLPSGKAQGFHGFEALVVVAAKRFRGRAKGAGFVGQGAEKIQPRQAHGFLAAGFRQACVAMLAAAVALFVVGRGRQKECGGPKQPFE